MKPYPIEFRKKIIEIYEKESISIRDLAQRFHVAKSFIQKLLKQYRETGDIHPQPQGGSPEPKLKGEQLIDLIEIIENYTDATLEELCDLLEEKLQVRVSRATMGRITHQFNYTGQKKTLYAAEKESQKIQEKRVDYWSKIREIRVENLIFIDESGVNLAMLRLYGRALKGKRARGKKPQKRGRNISWIAALSLDKIITSVNIYGSVDAITFEAFIANNLIPNLWENACVVLDNAKIHQGEIVKQLVEGAGATLIYLSPYSPEFSPIENFWSKVKALLRKTAARTYEDLIDGITNAMLNVTQDNIRNWFAHCCYCTS
ncbi:MAG: IS630 family transposase [Limnoraphis sp. WC205]|nr:IS630 family transposase [Limnoraphis sp. WC205]MCG5057481.1 IS630 family transposase [Limnoraphis sp. WC205]MCG5057670.1 IS630 family transposase [Limnoraphis sp. WC205]MCG5060220.1 IS630 family transposase [Limnoraphis sp. WC205]